MSPGTVSGGLRLAVETVRPARPRKTAYPSDEIYGLSLFWAKAKEAFAYGSNGNWIETTHLVTVALGHRAVLATHNP
jgi:hypothetical protein